jgi:homoserine dehydrogenase
VKQKDPRTHLREANAPGTKLSATAAAPTRVAILGFGTVGSSVAQLISAQKKNGVRITHVFNRGVARKRVAWMSRDVIWTERFEDLLSPEVDVIIELVGNVELAHRWISRALIAGKHVITANKQLIARHGGELVALAQQHSCRIAYGAAVGGVVPVIPAILEGLAADSFHRISGILNGTCNYVLSRMERARIAMPEAIAEAQVRGYTESDPTSDLDGEDAAAKLVILAAIAMQRLITPEQVRRQSIRTIDPVDFDYARMIGCTIRQISYAELNGKHLIAAVQPALVALDSPFAVAHGSDNLIAVYGKHSGRLLFAGAGAGGDPTAVAVLSDLLAIRRGHSPAAHNAMSTTEVRGDLGSRHYLRFVVKDRPGIVAGIAAVLARYRINIDALMQSSGHPAARLPFVITTEKSPADKVADAVKEIAKARYHVQPPLNLPVLDSL